MLNIIPKRSIGGCLTCKRRKKKCDERRPHCRRCELGDFDCLGYDLPNAGYVGESSSISKIELIPRPLHAPTMELASESSNSKPLDTLTPLPEYKVQRPSLTHILLREASNYLSNIPRGVRLDSTVLEDVTSLIVSQYVRFSQGVLFKAPLISIEQGLLRRINHSDVIRWSMYLGARVITDFLRGHSVQKYVDWIFRFYQQIVATSTPDEPGPSLEGRLSGLYDLICLGSMISGTTTGHSLLRCSTPLFLRLAALEPKIWVDNSNISIPEAFRNSRHEIIQFIIHDTMTALTLGTPPLLHYDTTSSWVDKSPGHYMEWIYGFPVELLILLAKISAWRASQIIGEVAQSQGDCREIEERLNKWKPVVDHTDEPSNNIARLAIQEAWRQAALIYLYLGVNQVNSADPRVESAVQQVVQLGSTITAGNPLELHILVPSLIAGVGARREKHRAALKNKVISELLRTVHPLVLPVRGPDFIAVLDHLWHGSGSGGRPVTWEDYVLSRSVVLPIE